MKFLFSMFCLLSGVFIAEAKAVTFNPRATILATWEEILPTVLSSCLNSTTCLLKNDEKTLLSQIFKDLPASLAQTKIIFVKGEERPDLFASPETPAHRLSVTGLRLGSPIYFDVSALQHLSQDKLLDYPIAIGMLIHELGHHQGIKDGPDRILDRVAARLRTFAEQMVLTLENQNLDQNPNQLQASFSVDIINTAPKESNNHSLGPFLPKLIYRSASKIQIHDDPAALQSFSCATYRLPRAQTLSLSWSNMRWTGKVKDSHNFTQEWMGEADESVVCLTEDRKLHEFQGVRNFRIRLKEDSLGNLVADAPDSFLSWSVSLPPKNSNWSFKMIEASNQFKNSSWDIEGSFEAPANKIISKCEVFYTSELIEIPRYIVFPNQWKFRTCEFNKKSSNIWQFKSELDIPPDSQLTHARVTELILVLEDGERVRLAPERRQEIRFEKPVNLSSTAVQVSIEQCTRNSRNCFGVLRFSFAADLTLRHIQMATTSFHADDSNVDKWHAPSVDTSVDAREEWPEEISVFESGGRKHLLWKIPSAGVDANVQILALISYRLIFGNFSSASSGNSLRLPIINR